MGFEFPGQARMAEVAQAITEAALRPPEPPPDALFTPFTLRGAASEEGLGLTLRNRVKLAAMTTGFASPDGLPTARLIAWYEARAAGGTGLVTVEGALVAPLHPLCSRSRFDQHRLRLDEDGCVEPYRPLTAALHRAGAAAAVQLAFPAVRDVLALSAAEIAALMRAFGAAAARARDAGFDAVELQCTYRSLLAQLLSPATNRRRDRYGRGPQGRLRAVREALGAIRERAGAAFPVIVKYSADELLPRGIRPPGPGGGIAIGRALAESGATLEVLAGAVASDAQLRLSGGVGEAVLADLAALVKEAVGVSAPVVAAGRLLTGDGAEAVLRRGQGDLVAVGRALLADPAWLAKTRAGVELEVAPCIGCMACYTPAPDGGIGCPVNGEAGLEYLPPLQPASRPRRIAVLGANLPALELARVAAARGHDVALATAGLPLGGLLGLRAGVPGNAELGRAFLYFGERLVELGVSLEAPAGADDPGGADDAAGAGDATGARGRERDGATTAEVVVDCRPGAELRPAWARGRGVFTATDILGRDLHEMYGIGRRVAVVGPGVLAAEVALFLAGWGRRPTVIVPGLEDDPFPDAHPMHAARLRERLEGYKVPLVAGAQPLAWRYDPGRKSALVVRRRRATAAAGGDGGGDTGDGWREETLAPFQTVITAAGWPAVPGQGPRVPAADDRQADDAALRWPQAVRTPAVPQTLPDGETLVLGDTPFAEPLRDLVQYAHLLGRIL